MAPSVTNDIRPNNVLCCFRCSARRGSKSDAMVKTSTNSTDEDFVGGTCFPSRVFQSRNNNADFKPAAGFSDIHIPRGDAILELGQSPGAPIVKIPSCDSLTEDERIPSKQKFGLHDVLELCRTGKILEAAGLRDGLGDEYANRKDDSVHLLRKLQCVNGRMRNAMDTVLMPSTRAGMNWTSFEMRDNRLGKQFVLETALRFATPEEVLGNPRKNESHFFARGTLCNFPLKFSHFVALFRELDLWKKEWLQDCSAIGGSAGNRDQLYSGMCHVLISPTLLPTVCLEDLFIREFSVCPEAPLNGIDGGGVMMVETSVPDTMFEREYEGFQVPKHKKGSISLSKKAVLYITPSKMQVDCCDIVGAGRLALPLPQWMIPLNLMKRIIARLIIDSILLMKSHVIDRWDKLDLKNRINENPDFYNDLTKMEVEATRLA